jgi:hypothetical protein
MALRFGQNCLASVSLTITTGLAAASSRSSNGRPSTSRTRAVPKYSGLTAAVYTVGGRRSGSGGRSSGATSAPSKMMPSGGIEIHAT